MAFLSSSFREITAKVCIIYWNKKGGGNLWRNNILASFPLSPELYIFDPRNIHPNSPTRSDLRESRRQLNKIILAIASEFVRVEGDLQSRYVGEVRKWDRETKRGGANGMDRKEYGGLEFQQEWPVCGKTGTNNCRAELNIVPDQALHEGNYFNLDSVRSIGS